jgi:peptidoglycan/LPS O-acetylase OafA/YrhL
MAGVQYKAETGKLDYIDALRGIAALSVFFYHVHGTMWIFTGIMPLQMIPNKYIQLNMASVPLFFIISSFTLYLSLDNKFDEKRKFLKFYIRRFFRIAPLFYVLLILVVLEAFIIQNRFPSWLEVLANFTFVFNLAPQYSQSLFSDGWTVGVEMIFYLFCH